MCLFPTLIDNPKYKPNKKNEGRVPPCFDERIKKVPIGCGQCMECRKKKSREWTARLMEEIKETLDRLNAYTSKSFEKQVNSEINKMNKAGLFDIKNMKVTNCLD